MKKFYIALLIFGTVSKIGFAQSPTAIFFKDTSAVAQGENAIRTANNLKSGNWQDVATSFFKLSFNDLTGPSKTLNFKTNLFALKVKADSTLLIDTNYIKHKFDRNFQFNVGVMLDTSYRLKGFSTGFTWVAINKRDSSVIRFKQQYYSGFLKKLPGLLKGFQITLQDKPGHYKSATDSTLYVTTYHALQTMLSNGVFIVTNFPAGFQQYYNTLPIATRVSQAELAAADTLFKHDLAQVALQPLLTFSVNGIYDNTVKKFNSADGSLIFLKGLTTNADGSGAEFDLRSSFTLTDTTLNALNVYRNIFDVTAGANFVFAKLHKSYFEIKPYFQYQNILNGAIPNEKTQDVYFNAEIRLKISDTMWIPLTLKYDVAKANVLGFLNVTFNLDAFKSGVK